LASADPELIIGVLSQSPKSSDRIAQVLEHSRTVNDALEEVVGAGILRNRALNRAGTFTSDLVNLLDKLKKDDAQ
jgi:hypothetical protein